MIVDSYSIKGDRYNVMTGMTVNLVSESPTELLINKELVSHAYRNVSEIGFGSPMPVPEKIFRCGDVTTVIWKDGTKTIVKLMPGADDSDYGAFTAALAKKIYGNNSKVMRYAGMVQRVKSKAEKKATRKLKRKYEEKITGEKRYIVTQYGEVAEYKGDDDGPFGNGHVVMIFAKTRDEAREKAYAYFTYTDFRLFTVYSNGRVEKEPGAYLARYFGVWRESLHHNSLLYTAVFAKSQEEALAVLEINPAPKEGDKP